MVLAIVLVLIVLITVLFTFYSPWWFTPLASNWGTIDDALIITFAITGFVFVAVTLFMALAIFKFRHVEGRKAAFEPENKKLEWWLIGVTTIGIAGMLAPGLIVWADYVKPPPNAGVFEAVGQQWSWSFRLPGKDGKLGRAAVRFITDDNILGVDPRDANGLDDLIIDGDDLHLLLNQPVKANLRSLDVLHDFYVPQFRAKMDLVPGMVTYFWFTPTLPGSYEILCAELCGLGHSDMRSLVVVDEPGDYQAWLSEQITFAEMIAPEDVPEDMPEEVAEEAVESEQQPEVADEVALNVGPSTALSAELSTGEGTTND
ncbi:MAG: cytochrome c oxidase subunit II [Kordiimonadaceae bacterium]|nr:cytochrome c oxidase subunit II [Kordiimonadaceae bacterium]